MNVKVGLVKTEPTSQMEVLMQPIFSNPLVINVVGRHLGVSGLSEGRAIAKARCTIIKDLWDREDREWKNLSALGMNSHFINRTSGNIIISNIPSNPVVFLSGFQTGNWINTKATGHLTLLMWIYRMTGVLSNLVQAIEFRRISPNGFIRAMSFQKVTFSPEGYHLIRVLSQEKHITLFKVVKDLSVLPKSFFSRYLRPASSMPPMGFGRMALARDPQLGDLPFFGYSAKRGYRNVRRPPEVPVIHSFIQQLNLNNSMDP
jgi:hypothetical protein